MGVEEGIVLSLSFANDNNRFA